MRRTVKQMDLFQSCGQLACSRTKTDFEDSRLLGPSPGLTGPEIRPGYCIVATVYSTYTA